MDRVLGKVMHVVGPSSTRGLVEVSTFLVLPNVEGVHAAGLTVVLQMPVLVKLWRRPSVEMFMCALALCGYASFMVGYHVHEKAILLVLLPFS